MVLPYFWNSPFQVDTGTNGNQPSLTVLADGRQVVAWRDGTLGSARLR